MLAAVIVAIYAGPSLPTVEFPTGFNFAEPAVLTQNWTSASVCVATAVALGLLAAWIGWRSRLAAGAPGARSRARALVAGLAAVSLVAVAQMTSHVSRAATPARRPRTTGFVAASGLKPGEQVAVASTVSYSLWAPQAFEVSWTELEFFNPPPAAAGREDRGRGGLAGRPARVGQLAERPGRVAHRRRQPGGGWVAWRHS